MKPASEQKAFFTGLPWPRDPPTPWIPRDSPFALGRWAETYAGWYLPASRGQYAPRVRQSSAARHPSTSTILRPCAGGARS